MATQNVSQQNEIRCAPAYFKHRWVWIPLPHAPEEAFGANSKLYSFKFSPIDKNEPIEALERRNCNEALQSICAFIREKIDPELLSDRALKDLCKSNNIPLGYVTDRFPQSKLRASLDSTTNHGTKRARRSLKPASFRRFLTKLKSINKRSALIAQILWYLNRNLGRVGIFITLEELLRLSVNDIALEDSEQWICLQRVDLRIKLRHRTMHPLPTYLWKALRRQIHRQSWLVFSNRNGGPLLPSHINAHFAQAGKKAGIQGKISSLSLRRSVKIKAVKKTNTSPKKKLQEVSLEEWELICHRVPSIQERRGRKQKYAPRDILNGILYHLREGCPIRELPPQYPSWKAVDSQYRRWKKKGVFQRILASRQK